MDIKDIAARLTEKIYSIKGSNQANEVQKLIEDHLHMVYKAGVTDKEHEGMWRIV